MKTYLIAASAVALIATMSIALAQGPKGEGGQKEMSQPPMKESSAEKDTPKAGERTDAPTERRAQQDKAPRDASKDTAKDGKKEAADKPKDSSKQATGKDKAGKAGGANLSQEQRTKVKSSFAKHRGKSANINITVNVGVAVPRSVQLYAIPADIVVLVPTYRRYRYFVVDDRICIVDPDTYEIVEIIILV